MREVICRFVRKAALVVATGLLIEVFLDHGDLPSQSVGIAANWGGIGFQKFRIAISLFVWFAASLFRNRISISIQVVSLAWIVAEYLLWWWNSRGFLSKASDELLAETPKFILLFGASWLDIAVILTVIALFVCLFVGEIRREMQLDS